MREILRTYSNVQYGINGTGEFVDSLTDSKNINIKDGEYLPVTYQQTDELNCNTEKYYCILGRKHR